jgi:hypothetical protein
MITTAVPPVLDPARRAGFTLVLIALLGFVALCLTAKLAFQTGLSWRCPMMTVFHVPCPSCGSTRAFAALSELHFLAALRFNPLLVCAIPIGLFGFLLRRFLKPYARLGWPLFAAVVAANWIYLYLFLPR